MRRIPAWVLVGVFGFFLATMVLHRAWAQPAPRAPAEAPAKLEPDGLGVELRDLSETSVKALRLAHLLLVVLPLPGGPAERAGLQPGDIIVELDGAAVGTLQDFVKTIQRLGAGKTITLGVLRQDERVALRATLGGPVDSRNVPDPADLLVRRIAAYQSILQRLVPRTFGPDWAALQHDLGNAYQGRIGGDRADSLEKAIAAYEAALTVRTREALPQDWARTQTNLGNAYRDRIRGDRADNVEMAIAAYEVALTVSTREAMPDDWAQTRHNLAIAYWSRIRGDRADNLERAIASYEAALRPVANTAIPPRTTKGLALTRVIVHPGAPQESATAPRTAPPVWCN